MLKRLTFAAPFALLIAFATPATASVVIGQLPASSPFVNCNSARDLVQPAVSSGNTYVVPALPPATSLVVSSWSHKTTGDFGSPTLTMKVFRKVGDPEIWQVVGHDGPRALSFGSTGVVDTFSGLSIPVKPGDVLGVGVPEQGGAVNGPACYFQGTGETNMLGRPGYLADGTAGTFSSIPSDRVNVSAVVAPSNAFTLGRLTRNKKNGSATLSVNVPNPGELALAGKGVKDAAASGAVIAKTVTAPGAVKLRIKATGKQKHKLSRSGQVKLKPTVSFTPTGGEPSAQSLKVKLRKR